VWKQIGHTTLVTYIKWRCIAHRLRFESAGCVDLGP
jgi:hypothetical protein